MRNAKAGIISVVGLLLIAGVLRAQTVYVSRGPDGELSFSDQPSEDVEQVLELGPVPSPLNAAATSAERVTELLRVADALAESREARERLRAERRAWNQTPPAPPPAAPPDPPVAQPPLWFPPLRPPRPGFHRPRYGDPAYAGRRYPGDGRYDRRDPRLDNHLLPGREPHRSSPLPPR